MTLLLDRPPLLGEPPLVPPAARKPDEPGEPGGRYIIVPDLVRAELRWKTQHDNCWTLHYFWMNRIWGAFERIEVTCVNSRVYRTWLDVYPMPDGIPPHIQFGGAVVSGEGDPTFHDRWKEYARRTFV